MVTGEIHLLGADDSAASSASGLLLGGLLLFGLVAFVGFREGQRTQETRRTPPSGKLPGLLGALTCLGRGRRCRAKARRRARRKGR